MSWKIPGMNERRGLRRSELKAIRQYVNACGGPEAFRVQLEECRFLVVAKRCFEDLTVQHNPFDNQFYLGRRGYDKGEYTVAEETFTTFNMMISRIVGA